MQIIVRSDERRHPGQTTLAAMIAAILAGNKGYKCFLTTTLLKDTSMEDYILKEEERRLDEYIGESNIDGLMRRIRNGIMTSQMLKDYCFSILPNSGLDFLQSGKCLEGNELFRKSFLYLMTIANEFYDVVVIDMEDKTMDFVTQVSAHPVIELWMIEPNFYRMKEIVRRLEVDTGKYAKSKESSQTERRHENYKLLIINQWENMDYQVLKKEIKNIHEKGGFEKVFFIPYDPHIRRQTNRHELIDYILRQSYNLGTAQSKKLVDGLNSLVEYILKIAEKESTHVL